MHAKQEMDNAINQFLAGRREWIKEDQSYKFYDPRLNRVHDIGDSGAVNATGITKVSTMEGIEQGMAPKTLVENCISNGLALCAK
jgi:hypothetical protein